MICPVCDHVQERGARCDVCGRDLASEGAIEEPVEVLEGLEPTRLPEAPALAGESVPGLEPTGLGSLVLKDEPRPEAVACPYCRTPTTRADVFCERCGMKLPIYRARPASPVSGGPAPLRSARCRACGGLLLHGPACANCGASAPDGEP